MKKPQYKIICNKCKKEAWITGYDPEEGFWCNNCAPERVANKALKKLKD